MNTTDISTIGTSHLMSCKNSIGRAGPGSDKLVSNNAVTSEAGGSNAGDVLTSNAKADASKAGVSDAGSRDLTYAPYTSPPHSLSRRGSFCHTNGRSNRVTRTRIHHTGPSTGGRPLLVGTPANALPNEVLPSLESGFGAGECDARRPSARSPSVARGASAAGSGGFIMKQRRNF